MEKKQIAQPSPREFTPPANTGAAGLLATAATGSGRFTGRLRAILNRRTSGSAAVIFVENY